MMEKTSVGKQTACAYAWEAYSNSLLQEQVGKFDLRINTRLGGGQESPIRSLCFDSAKPACFFLFKGVTDGDRDARANTTRRTKEPLLPTSKHQQLNPSKTSTEGSNQATMSVGAPFPQEAQPYTWDDSRPPPQETLQLWTDVSNGIDKSQTGG